MKLGRRSNKYVRLFGAPKSLCSPGKSKRKELFTAKHTFHSSFTSCSFSIEQDTSEVSQDGNANTSFRFFYKSFHHPKSALRIHNVATSSAKKKKLHGQLLIWLRMFGILWDATAKHPFQIEGCGCLCRHHEQPELQKIDTSKCEVTIFLYFPHTSSYHISFGYAVGCHMIHGINTANFVRLEVWRKLYGDQ